MSQSGNFKQGGGPAGGIQTLTGNNGLAVPPDGGGDVEIVGAGDITVTGDPLTNTLTITSAAVATNFTTNFGATAPVAGNLNVFGGTNINTAVAGPGTIEVNLNNDVTLGGHLQVGNGADIANGLTITSGGINSTGLTVLDSLTTAGVMQVNALHEVFSDDGTGDGQLLISANAGAPQWANLTAGAGIAITNGANSITISSAAGGALTAHTDAGDAVEVANAITWHGGTNINTQGAGSTVTINLDPSVILAGSLTAGATITAQNSIISNTGDIRAITGDIITTTGDVISNGGVLAGQGLTVANNGINSSGPTILTDLTQGVVQALTGGTLYSSDSAIPGQFLISGTGNPAWGGLTSSDGSIDITPGDHTIDIKAIAAGGGASAFRAYQTADANHVWESDGNAVEYYLGSLASFTVEFDESGGVYPGDGAGQGTAHAAYFTVPATGKWFFSMQIRFDPTSINAANFLSSLSMRIGTLADFERQSYNGYSLLRGGSSGSAGVGSLQTFQIIEATAGDQIYFWALPYQAVYLPRVYMDIDASSTWISGFKLASSSGSGSGASDFISDAGTAVQVGGSLNVQGGSNINTAAVPAGGQNLIVNLDDNVVIPIGGTITLPLTDGVMQTTSTGLVTSTPGTNGQVLIGSSLGAPSWNTLTAGTGVSITNASNNIVISANGTGSLAPGFQARQTLDATNVISGNPPPQIFLGEAAKLDTTVGTTPATWFPGLGTGLGLGGYCYYTCPSTGMYYFLMQLELYTADPATKYFDVFRMDIQTPSFFYFQDSRLLSLYPTNDFAADPGLTLQFSCIGHLTVGDKVYFAISCKSPIGGSTAVTFKAGQTMVCGYQIS